MMKAKKRSIHGLGPVRGDDQRTLGVFFKNAPSCPVCGVLYQTGTISAWIDGHILDCHIPMPQYTGSFGRNDAGAEIENDDTHNVNENSKMDTGIKLTRQVRRGLNKEPKKEKKRYGKFASPFRRRKRGD